MNLGINQNFIVNDLNEDIEFDIESCLIEKDTLIYEVEYDLYGQVLFEEKYYNGYNYIINLYNNY